MCEKISQLSKHTSIIFNQSISTQLDELTKDRFMHMTFEEFRHGIAKLASILTDSYKEQNPFPTFKSGIPSRLDKKLESLISMLAKAYLTEAKIELFVTTYKKDYQTD